MNRKIHKNAFILNINIVTFLCISNYLKCIFFVFLSFFLFLFLHLQILDVLCSLGVCHGMAVRSNQHLICDTLLPERDLLLQTRLVNQVFR